ncbi:MAG TPA: FkbM family methyltransferase [Bryobacteraceae bacterium]|jgi:FkbM family methyltransferase|nr:FkbM family methyltransferase [Bryobacteraceae bacterium]
MKVIKICLMVAGLVILLAAAWPEARLTMVWAAGRCQGCSFRGAVKAHALLVDMERAGVEIGAASKVIERDPQGFELVQTPMGQYWTVPNDRFLKFTLGEEKLEIYDGDEVAVKPGDVVLDCGANVGVFTRTALKRGASLVVAIEPAPATVVCLRRNFEKEIAEGKVIVVSKGVWDHTDTLELAEGDNGNTTGDSFVFGRDAKRKVKVPLTTIDILAGELKLPRVDFIKMDIEAAEKAALRGAAETIRKFHPRMAIASEHLPDDVTAIPQTVANIWGGYHVTPTSCKDAFLEIRPEVLLFQPR